MLNARFAATPLACDVNSKKRGELYYNIETRGAAIHACFDCTRTSGEGSLLSSNWLMLHISK